MRILRNTGTGFLFMLVASCLFVVSHAYSVCCNKYELVVPDQHIPVSGIQNSMEHFDLTIELNNFVSGISEIHKLLSVAVLTNRVIPLNFNFRGMIFIPVKLNSITPVPIFIKGHSLLN